MSSALAAFVALMSLAVACIYWQEVKFQQSQTAVEEENHRAAIESAYIGIATSLASAALRVFFILFGIQAVLNQSSVGSATALVPAIALAVLVSGGVFLLERVGRAYQTFVIDSRLHLNNTAAATFLADTAKALLVSALFALPLVAGWVWLMESGSSLWWLAVWALWLAILSARMALKPHLETLLFARARDLPAGELRKRLATLLARCGVKARSLRVVEASKRTSRLNASVTGLGAHKHILLFDTLVQRLGVAEVEAVLAHEAGHVQHGHLTKAWAGLALLGLAAAYTISEAVRALGLRPAETVGLTLAVYPSAFFCLRPLFVRISRFFEFEADAFAAKMCGVEPISAALRAIFNANRGVFEHHWSYAAVFCGHPSGRERLLRLKGMNDPF